MAVDLYLESALRDGFGVSDSLMKKTRREFVAGLAEDPCRLVIIQGRTHVAYPLEVVRGVFALLCGKKTRGEAGCSEIDYKDGPCAGVLDAALVRGVTCEIQGDSEIRSQESGVRSIRADMVTLKVAKITKNRLILLAEHPDGTERPPVRLRVKDTGLFTIGMDVPGCRHVEEDLYEYAGRQPRSRGRW